MEVDILLPNLELCPLQAPIINQEPRPLEQEEVLPSRCYSDRHGNAVTLLVRGHQPPLQHTKQHK